MLLGEHTVDALACVTDQLISVGESWETAFGRQVCSWVFEDFDRCTPPPDDLCCAVPIVHAILDVLEALHPNDRVLPSQCFVNYYGDGSQSAELHYHHYRQATMSLGATRPFVFQPVGGLPVAIEARVQKRGDGTVALPLEPGEVVVLDGQLCNHQSRGVTPMQTMWIQPPIE